MKFAVYSQLAGKFPDSETGSLETAPSSGESIANLFEPEEFHRTINPCLGEPGDRRIATGQGVTSENGGAG